MVNAKVTDVGGDTADRDIDRQLLMAHVPARAREGVTALLALDDALGDILRSMREPMVGQMRLTWWHGALTALDGAPPPAQPVLQALADGVVPMVRGADLARQIEGWEELLDPEPLGPDRLDRYAAARGGGMFKALAHIMGVTPSDATAAAGQAWALADLATHLRDAEDAERAAALGRRARHAAFARPWPRSARPLGALTLLAAERGRSPPARAVRLVWHRLTGR